MGYRSPYTTRYPHLSHFKPIPSNPDTHFHAFVMKSKRMDSGLFVEIREWCEEQFGAQSRLTWTIDTHNVGFTVYDETLAMAFMIRWC